MKEAFNNTEIDKRIKGLKAKKKDAIVDMVKDYVHNCKLDTDRALKFAAYTIMIDELEKEENNESRTN